MNTQFAKPLPLLPLRNVLLYPGVSLPIVVGRPLSVQAVKASRNTFQNWIVVVTQFEDKEPIVDHLPSVGILAEIKTMEGSDQQGYHVFIEPKERVKIHSIETTKNFLSATFVNLPDIYDVEDVSRSALIKSLQDLTKDVLSFYPADHKEVFKVIEESTSLEQLSHIASSSLDISLKTKQDLLEQTSLRTRVLQLLEMLTKKKEELQVTSEIRNKLSQKIGKGQRDAILREQLKTIREELGETEDISERNTHLKKKIEDAQMPQETEKIALEELKRLESIGSQSPEANVIRNYIEILCSLPWSHSSTKTIDEFDLKEAQSTLDHDHYGIDKVKKRILQHLATMKLRQSVKGSILLFIGPPGVGKTSLGQSIAKTLSRKFVRVSLGGIRDDADIRGHRRTYVGAMPGRIIQALKRAGENNPVIMLDEIDKMGRGFAGDPAAALLEVLDPEQNNQFFDHYLDVPFDLSKIFFIATANSFEGIPAPLLDRMEVIDLSGYTVHEKLFIAKNHLIKKLYTDYNLTEDQLHITEDALKSLISDYTREAGVRELNRKIEQVIRASSEKVLIEKQQVTIREADLEPLIGIKKFEHEIAQQMSVPGVVTGLAWTPVGGEILFVETITLPGKGQVTLTGQLGEVMRESAQIALSLVKASLAEKFISINFEKTDIHIHVPAGSIPKDGPSAGVTMLTSIASQLTKIVVPPDLAMTGEITLRGAVTPIGGIKEKVIAAHRAGIKKIILSAKNKKDLVDVPDEIKSQMKFYFVNRIEEVLELSLGVKLDMKKEGTQAMPEEGSSSAYC